MADKPHYSPAALDKRRAKNRCAWIRRATEIHGDKFDYSPAESTFTVQKGSVRIRCCRHARDFETTAFGHLRSEGGGCPTCEWELRSEAGKRRGREVFLRHYKSHLAHRLELLSEYQGMKEPIEVRCKQHRRVKVTTPDVLAHGGTFGCDVCAREAQAQTIRLSLEDVRNRFRAALPEHVHIVDLVVEARRPTQVVVDCTTHGRSTVAVGYLQRSLEGKGHFCPRCGDEKNGYAGYRLQQLLETDSACSATWLGVMEVEALGIRTLKVGVSTRSLTARYGPDLKTLFFTARLPEREALLIENEVHRVFVDYRDKRILKAGMRRGQRWPGDTECYAFRIKSEVLRLVQQRLDEVTRGTFPLDEAVRDFQEPDFSTRNVARGPGVWNGPKPVVCIDTGKEFPSVTAAAFWGGCSQGNLSAALRGERRMAGGYRWVFADQHTPGEVEPLPPKRYRRKKVVCIEDGHVFDSLSEAGRVYGISSSHITSVCKGRRKSAGGRTWQYAD